MRTFLTILLSLTLLAACSDTKKKEKTTPDPGPTKVDTGTSNTQNTVPLDHETTVMNTWNSGLDAVKNCIAKRIAKTGQKGLNGYIIVEGKIGLTENPKDLRIVENKLKVTQIEECILTYLKDLSFPTWGYEVTYQHNYSVNIMY